VNARPRALGYALAALSAVVVIGLGVRISGQLDDLSDARIGAPGEALAQRLKALGFVVRQSTLVAATPAGRNLVVARFTAEGEADAVAIDRLALWTGANARSAILESLAATAGADGKSDVKLELDALVRQTGVKPTLARPA